MGIQVNSLNVFNAKEQLKQCPKIVKQYVESLENAVERRMGVVKRCIEIRKEQEAKIKELERRLSHYELL